MEVDQESDFLINHTVQCYLNESTFPKLDCPFTCNEIKKAIRLLGANKATSLDNMMYEYFKMGSDVLCKPLEIMFNYISEKESYPKSWSNGVNIPVYKKGDETKS